MNHRKNARIIGIFYILAAVSSIIAVLLYTPIMSADWYLVVENEQRNQVLLGVLNDVILLVSAVGTAIFLSPYLVKENRSLTWGYVSFRFMEAVFIGIGLVSVLVLISMSDGFATGSLTNSDQLISAGWAWQGVHRWTMVLGPNFMLGVNTILYSSLLLKTRLVPKWLAQFGILTAIMVLIAGLLDFFSIIEPWSTIKGLISLPIGVFEMSLAVYLIAKGFQRKANASAVTFSPDSPHK